MGRSNAKKVMRNAAGICRRLRTTSASVTSLMRQYHCSYFTIMRAVTKHIKPAEWKEIRKKKLAQGGVKTRFQKGQVSWNRGKYGIRYSPATEFKKGHVPANHKKLYTITIRTRRATKKRKGGSYRMIAVPGPTPTKHKWISYAQWRWEQRHGPIPKGYFVVHRDGNRLNDTLRNYKLVDRKEHLALIHKNNPEARKISGRKMKKYWAAKRKQKAIEAKRQERAKQLLQEQMVAEREKDRVFGPKVTWWECIGCGNEFNIEPSWICPKCNGFRFTKITKRTPTRLHIRIKAAG